MRRITIILSILLILVAGTAFAQHKEGPIDAAGGFISTNYNTTYEELTAIAFDSQNRSIIGTIMVKQVVGFNGNHVVACWVDWNNDGVYYSAYYTNEYVGVATRYTPNPPSAPLYYGVSIPISPLPGTLNKNYNVKCILTWGEIPTNSNYNSIWGNAITGNIHIDALY
jgi:hypothetical protein